MNALINSMSLHSCKNLFTPPICGENTFIKWTNKPIIACWSFPPLQAVFFSWFKNKSPDSGMHVPLQFTVARDITRNWSTVLLLDSDFETTMITHRRQSLLFAFFLLTISPHSIAFHLISFAFDESSFWFGTSNFLLDFIFYFHSGSGNNNFNGPIHTLLKVSLDDW